MSTKKPLRSKLASSVSRSAAALSRVTGRGDGAVIGGKLGLMIDPNLLANLAAGRQIALISGTNGKTTTTRLTAAAMGVLGEVATNSLGANMPTGHTSALARAGDTPYAVLEVDEHYLPQVLKATDPRVVALLNLSRDQLDRAKEVAMMADLWRRALAEHPVHVVGNADDPMIVWGAQPAVGTGVTWVAAGQRWRDDSWVCPECGSHIARADGSDLPNIATEAPRGVVVPDSGAVPGGVGPAGSGVVPGGAVAPVPTGLPTVPVTPPGGGALVPGGGGIVPGNETTAMVTGGEPTVLMGDPDLTVMMPGSSPGESPQERTKIIPVNVVWPPPKDSAPPVAASPAGRAASGPVGADPDDWWCTGCSLRRPVPDWRVDGDTVIDPTGRPHPVRLQLPGRVNRANAATALAVAAHFGVDPARGAERLSQVASIAGRYAQVQRDGRTIRLLLAKNPAGWLEAFDMAEDVPTLLSINSRDPDGLDTSWLFDVDFSPLRGRRVLITGERAFDLAVRLETGDIAFTHVPTFADAVAAVPSGRLEVIANYTAFQDIRAELDRVN